MRTIDVPGFGRLDLTEEGDYYEAELALEGHSIPLELDIAGALPDYGILTSTRQFIDDLPKFDSLARQAIRADYFHAEPDAAARLYLEHYIDEVGPAAAGFGPDDIQGLLTGLRLFRIAFVPEEPDGFAVFDYGLAEPNTQYFLAVTFSHLGEVGSVDMES